MIQSISNLNYAKINISQNRRDLPPVNFQANAKSGTQKSKKNTALGWAVAVGGVACAVAFFPAARMKLLNLFNKQVPENIIKDAIRKNATEMANLKTEKAVFINPKTGKVVQSEGGTVDQVNSNLFINIRNMFLHKNTIFGHNHPELIVPIKNVKYDIHCKDVPFSYSDLLSGLRSKSNHCFVVTQKNIHHVKFNNNFNENKFLDYLESQNMIELKDRNLSTINKAVAEITFEPQLPENGWENINSETQLKDFFENKTSDLTGEKLYKEMSEVADKMGWTYWREPISKV